MLSVPVWCRQSLLAIGVGNLDGRPLCPASWRPEVESEMSRIDGMADPAPHHLVAAQEFAGDRFWSAVDRLAARLGHGDHSRQLLGEVERLNYYALRCAACRAANRSPRLRSSQSRRKTYPSTQVDTYRPPWRAHAGPPVW
jgi:hypothetical protein